MKFLLCLIFSLSFLYSYCGSNKPISINKEKYTVSELMKLIEGQTGLKFSFLASNTPLEEKVFIKKNKYELNELLKIFMDQIGFNYMITKNNIAIKFDHKPIVQTKQTTNIPTSKIEEKKKIDTVKKIETVNIPKKKKDTTQQVQKKANNTLNIPSFKIISDKKEDDVEKKEKKKNDKKRSLDLYIPIYPLNSKEELPIRKNQIYIENQEVLNCFYPIFLNATLNSDVFYKDSLNKYSFLSFKEEKHSTKIDISNSISKITFGNNYLNKKIKILLSGRYYYNDYFVKKVYNNNKANEGYFFDFSGVVDYDLTNNIGISSKLYYYLKDNLNQDDNRLEKWSNLVSISSFNYKINKLTFNTNLSLLRNNVSAIKWNQNKITNSSYKISSSLYNDFYNIEVSGEFEQNKIQDSIASNEKQFATPTLKGEIKYDFNDNSSIRASLGLIEHIQLNSDSLSKSYIDFNSKVTFDYRFNFGLKLKLSIEREVSFKQLVTLFSGVPVNTWITTNSLIKPLAINSLSIEAKNKIEKIGLETKLESKISFLQNKIDFKDNSTINRNLENQVLSGTGRNIEVGFSLKYPNEIIDAEFSYFYYNKTNNIEGINNGKSYREPFSTSNEIFLKFGFSPNKYINVKTNANIILGRYMTLPSNAKFEDISENYQIVYGRSKFELPGYINFDISITMKQFLEYTKNHIDWTLAVKNIFSPNSIYYPSIIDNKVRMIYLNYATIELKCSFKF